MKTLLRNELISHVIETISNQQLTEFEELHHLAFNEDYYIIGYFPAKEWLKKHDIDAFDAIAYVMEQELEHFGEVNLKPENINSEKMVNIYVYFTGQELINEFDLNQDVDSLLFDLKSELS